MDSKLYRVMWEKIETKYIGAKFGDVNRNTELPWNALCNEMMKIFHFF